MVFHKDQFFDQCVSCSMSIISTDARINLGFTSLQTTLTFFIRTLVNSELQNLYNWLTANKLTLNINKSNFVIFHPYQKRLAYQPKLCMFDNEKNKYVRLKSKVDIKYLGIKYQNLSWSTTFILLLQKLVKMLG